MYSPRIHHALIPALYHTARSRQIPMTHLVNELVVEGLSRRSDMPHAASEALAGYTADSVKPKHKPTGENHHAQSMHQLQ